MDKPPSDLKLPEGSADQMALLYQLGIALASGQDLYTTLLTLYTEILKLVQVDALYVAIYNQDTGVVDFPIYFEMGVPRQYPSRRLSEQPGLTGGVIRNGQTLYLPDSMIEDVIDMYAPVDDPSDAILHTYLGVPLVVNGNVIGVLSVQSTYVDAYTPDHIRLMENVGIQAALAIDKARLLDRLKQELEERRRIEIGLRQRESILEAVTFAAEQFLDVPDWRTGITTVLERLGRNIQATHAYLFEIHKNEHGNDVHSLRYEWTAPGFPSDLDKKEFQNTSLYEAGFDRYYQTLRSGEAFVGSTSTLLPIEREHFTSLGIKAILEVPLFVSGRWWGIMGFDDMVVEREWSTAELDALRIAAGILRAAIQRQKADSAVQESERIYRQAIEAADAVPYYYDYASNSYVFMGEGIRSMTGYGPEALTPALWSRIIEETLTLGDVGEFELPKGSDSASSGKVKAWKRDQKIRTRDGQIRWLTDRSIQLFDDSNISYGSIGILQDVTERKLVESSLRQRESLLQALTFSAEQFLKAPNWRESIDLVLEKLGRELNVSHAYLFEKSRSPAGVELTSMTYEWTAPGLHSDLKDPRFQEIEPKAEGGFKRFYKILDSGEPLAADRSNVNEFEKEYLRSLGIKALLEMRVIVDGQQWGTLGFDEITNERTWKEVEIDVLKVAANMLGAAIRRQMDETALQHELEQRKELIAELEAKNEELERFTYTVSHDLKSPLVTISGFLGFLEEDALSGRIDRVRQDSQRIHDAVLKMQRLLNELLELSRIGRMMNPPLVVPFNDLVHEATEIVHGQLEERGIKVDLQSGLPTVYGDQPRLIEVLQNLLDNAAKYMGDQPDPVIEIGQRGEEHGKPVYFVRDNGIGIAPEHHERVFGLFNKLDIKTEGTGVGLALVRRIVEIHGGRIWVESEPGQGSTFLFTLPRSAAS